MLDLEHVVLEVATSRAELASGNLSVMVSVVDGRSLSLSLDRGEFTLVRALLRKIHLPVQGKPS